MRLHTPRAGEMTPRARGYLYVSAARHLGVGISCLIAADAFTTTSMRQIRTVMPLPLWGVLMVTVGVGCFLAAYRASEPVARVALVVSAAASTTWAAGFAAAALAGELENPILPWIFAALAGKDLVVCAQPLRSPFERLAEQLGQ